MEVGIIVAKDEPMAICINISSGKFNMPEMSDDEDTKTTEKPSNEPSDKVAVPVSQTPKKIENPYVRSEPKQGLPPKEFRWIDDGSDDEDDDDEIDVNKEIHTTSTARKSSLKVSAKAYSDVTKVKKNKELEHTHRFKFNYNIPRSGNKAPILQLLSTLMNAARDLDKDAMIMPWDDKSTNVGPIDATHLRFVNKLSITEAKNYINLPMDVRRIGFTHGRTEYGLGVRITTKLSALTFKDSWDLKKRDWTANRKQYIPLKFA